MAMYHSCPYCGSNLDPGERCDCQDKEKAASRSSSPESGEQNMHGAILASEGEKINE